MQLGHGVGQVFSVCSGAVFTGVKTSVVLATRGMNTGTVMREYMVQSAIQVSGLCKKE